jgi:hypothetical protein
MRVGFQRTVTTVCCVSAAGVGCTKAVGVPRSEYDAVEQGQEVRIYLRDGGLVRAWTFTVTEDAFMVTRILENNQVRKIDPMEIKFEEVESVERDEVSKTRTTLALVPVVAAVAVYIYMVAVFSLLSGT